METNKKPEGKEFILKAWITTDKNEKAGMFGESIRLLFENIEEDLTIGDKITTNPLSSQYLEIIYFDSILDCIINTIDYKEYLNPKDLQEGTIYYKL